MQAPAIRIRKLVLRAAIWCLTIAVIVAPVVTSLQMIELALAAPLASDVAMPCHGALQVTVPLVDEDAPTTATGACACTPWCHAAVTPASEFAFRHTATATPLPLARFMATKTADVPPRFKPPIA